MPTARSLRQNTLDLLISNGGSAVLSFLLSVLVGRVLGQDGLGVYVTVLAWVFPLALAAEFGLGTLMTRDLSQQPQDTGAYLRATTMARLLMGGGLAALLAVSAPWLSSEAEVVRGLQIAAPLVVIQPFYSTFTSVFRARRVMRPITVLNIGMLLVQVLLTGLVFAGGGGILAALVVNTATSAGQLVAAWAIYRARFYSPAHRQIALRPLLRRAYPFAAAALLGALHLRIGAILLESISGTAEVGYYGAAFRFIEAGRLLPQAFFDALFPLLAAMVATPAALERFFHRVLIGLAGFGLLSGLVFMAAALPLLELTYGPAFSPAVLALQIAGWSLLPLLLKSGRTLYCYAQGRERFVNIMTLAALGARLLLCLWLIPPLGTAGAMLAHLLAECIAMLLLWWPTRR